MKYLCSNMFCSLHLPHHTGDDYVSEYQQRKIGSQCQCMNICGINRASGERSCSLLTSTSPHSRKATPPLKTITCSTESTHDLTVLFLFPFTERASLRSVSGANHHVHKLLYLPMALIRLNVASDKLLNTVGTTPPVRQFCSCDTLRKLASHIPVLPWAHEQARAAPRRTEAFI